MKSDGLHLQKLTGYNGIKGRKVKGMKVAILLNQDIWNVDIENLKKQYPDVTFSLVRTNDELSEDIEVLITSNGFTEEDLIDKTNLKLIMVPFSGINQLPIQYLQERGLTVCNTHVHAYEVAERGLALTLALLGRVVELDRQFRSGWDAVSNKQWVSLFNKKVGILGMGAIGQALYALLKPFNIQLVTLKRYQSLLQKKGIEACYVDTIEKVCLQSEIVINILPLTPDTRGIIDHKILKRMQNKFLVNIGRGPTIEEEALYVALKDGILRGGAFDVWYQYGEHEPSKYPIHELPNVVISPHCAGITETIIHRQMEATLRNLENYINQKPLENVVQLNVGY